MKFNIREARFLRAVVKPDQAPRPFRPSVAFAGRSNAGKSSVINSLTRRRGLARSSNRPGRTQSIMYFDVNGEYYFVDLPGYGFAKVPAELRAQWGPMIEQFLKGAREIELVIVIIDIRRDPGTEDLQLVQWLEEVGIPYFFALTKTDKVRQTEIPRRLQAVRRRLGLADDHALLPYSSVSGMGRDELLEVIHETLSRHRSAAADDIHDHRAIDAQPRALEQNG